MRRRLFTRLVLGSLQRRWYRTAVAFAAVTLAGALVSAALSVSAGIGERTGRALRAYGANILILPRSSSPDADQGYLAIKSLEALARIPSAAAIQGIVPLLLAIARVGAAPVVLVGTDFAAVRTVNPWWQPRPDVRTLTDGSSAVVGANLAQALGLNVGDRITVRVGTRTAPLAVVALLSTGGAEDNQLLVNLALAQRLADRSGLVSLVQVSALGRSGDVSGIVEEIGRALPDLQVQSIRQVALAERRLLRRVELLLSLVAAVVMLAAGISVMATMSALALERRGEVALMKAIGGGAATVSGLFFLEAGGIGLGGGLVGYGLGWLLAQLVSRAMWASPIPASGGVLLATIITASALAVISSIVPVRRAMAIQPVVVLRGE